MKLFFLALSIVTAQAQTCPGSGSEPVVTVKISESVQMAVCGYEDHELKAPAGKRTFTEFEIIASPKEGEPFKKIFGTGPMENYWVKAVSGKGLELEELWDFTSGPQPALHREAVCSNNECKVSEPKCMLKMKRNPFPKALAQMEKYLKKADPKVDGEVLVDQVWAQALAGDKAARKFFAVKPGSLDVAESEAFDSDAAKLKQALELGCVK